MSEEYIQGNFLGLPENGGEVDVAILQLPYELTTSYGQGTAGGPAACIIASAQVELFDASLGEDLPAGAALFTAPEWDAEGNSLAEQLDNISGYLKPWYAGDCLPLILGGEHGILPPLLNAAQHHPLVNGNMKQLTVVQIDAHADLREQLGGEKYSHACAASRSLDLGIGRLVQIGIRAYSKQEADYIEKDERVTTFFARDTQSPSKGESAWSSCLDTLGKLTGPVHLTIDIDGLDGSIVPATGTPVPGGLSFWQATEVIEAVFSSPNATVISVDVNEIVAQQDTPLTQFTAAMIATKAIAMHLKARKEGRWVAVAPQVGRMRMPQVSDFFQQQRSSEIPKDTA